MSERITKAAILPVARDATTGKWRVYLMRPRGEKPELGAPPLQMAKGTRMWLGPHGWVDMRSEVPADALLEPLSETALREGEEELGLVKANVVLLKDCGIQIFRSATTGEEKPLAMFTCTLKNLDLWDKPAETTAESRWVGEAEMGLVRPDHAEIIQYLIRH